jgi:hypothetical protein
MLLRKEGREEGRKEGSKERGTGERKKKAKRACVFETLQITVFFK